MRSFSIVVELENATTISWDEVGAALRALQSELVAHAGSTRFAIRELIFVYAGNEQESNKLLHGIRHEASRLEDLAKVQFVGVPGGRYYQLKNAGAARASGEVIVFLDSDTFVQPGWLASLLEPFDQPETIAATGHTYLAHSDLISRTLALIWFFPLRENDPKGIRRRTLNANNCAFRAAWFKDNPFVIDPGFKVDCSLIVHRVKEYDQEIVRTQACVAHAPLRGWRFFCWRAMVTGRDNDRKYVRLKSSSKIKRWINALTFWSRMETRAIRRVLTLHGEIAMPIYEVPIALFLGIFFYSLTFLGQSMRLLGLARDRTEFIPSYVEHH